MQEAIESRSKYVTKVRYVVGDAKDLEKLRLHLQPRFAY
jgi:hypothetical protein